MQKNNRKNSAFSKRGRSESRNFQSSTKKGNRDSNRYQNREQRKSFADSDKVNRNNRAMRNEESFVAPEVDIQEESRLEGRNAVEEALKAGRSFNKVWHLKYEDGKKQDRRLQELLSKISQTQAVMYPLDRKSLDRMSKTYSHQGIIAEVAAHEYAELEQILALARERNENPFIILLDQIQDSQNLGAILRSADCVGAHGVIIPERRSVSLDAQAAKSSVGAIEHILCCRVTNLNRCIEELKDNGVWVAGLAMDGDSIFQENNTESLRGAIALVVGSEGKGISPSTEKNCDFLLSIPMRGQINSLNASNAAAIAMYEVLRARTKGDK